jgi:hypothetical protein
MTRKRVWEWIAGMRTPSRQGRGGGYSKLALTRLAGLGLLLGSLSEASAGLIYYTDRAVFDAANPGLLIEDFEDGIIADGAVAGFDGPLDTTTNNALFAPGDILPGIQFDSAFDGNNLALIGDQRFGASQQTNWVGINTFVDDGTVISLDGGFDALGMDLFATQGPGATSNDTFDIDIYDADGLIESTTIAVSDLGSFWGVSSDMGPITSIVISSQSDYAELFDNVAFGSAAIPEPTAALVFGVGWVVVGWTARRRR